MTKQQVFFAFLFVAALVVSVGVGLSSCSSTMNERAAKKIRTWGNAHGYVLAECTTTASATQTCRYVRTYKSGKHSNVYAAFQTVYGEDRPEPFLVTEHSTEEE